MSSISVPSRWLPRDSDSPFSRTYHTLIHQSFTPETYSASRTELILIALSIMRARFQSPVPIAAGDWDHSRHAGEWLPATRLIGDMAMTRRKGESIAPISTEIISYKKTRHWIFGGGVARWGCGVTG
jgi:hypothetical protein